MTILDIINPTVLRQRPNSSYWASLIAIDLKTEIESSPKRCVLKQKTGRRIMSRVMIVTYVIRSRLGQIAPVLHLELYLSCGGAVVIATGYKLDYRGVKFRFPVGSRIFFSPYRPYIIKAEQRLKTCQFSVQSQSPCVNMFWSVPSALL
jgi:hypothetical protein